MDTGELCQYKIVMVNNMDIIRREVYPEILVEALIKLSTSPRRGQDLLPRSDHNSGMLRQSLPPSMKQTLTSRFLIAKVFVIRK